MDDNIDEEKIEEEATTEKNEKAASDKEDESQAQHEPARAQKSSRSSVGSFERRGSRNIYNLKLEIPKRTAGNPVSVTLPEAPETSIPSQESTIPQTASVQPRAYERSQSSYTPHFPQKKPMNPRQRRQHFQRQSSILQRAAMIRSGSRRMMEATGTFVGIGKNSNEEHEKWRLRHLRYCSMKYGRLKPQIQQEVDEQETQNSLPTSPTGYFPQIYDPLSRGRTSRYYASAAGTPEGSEMSSFGPNITGGPIAVSTPPRTPVTPGARSLGASSVRFGPQLSTTLRRQEMRHRKDSFARMSWKVVSAVVKGNSVMDDLVRKHQAPDKRSFQLPSLAEEEPETVDELDTTFFMQDMPTIAEGESFVDEVFMTPHEETAPGLVHRRDLKRPEKPLDKMPPRGQRIGVQRVLSMALRRKKRQYGKGLVGNWLNRRMTRKRLNSHVKQQLDTFDDHRPYFSYWISFVHIVVTIISLCVYGIAPIGFTNFKEKFTTTKRSLSRVSEEFVEPQNFWIGPRTKDLIHLGAKYSPCMRQDPKLHAFLEAEKAIERESACCVRNDDSGCIQTSANECSSLFATWVKWPEFDPPDFTNGSAGEVPRTSGAVCGQDPRFCHSHVTGQAEEWPDDITKWPICTDPNIVANNTPYTHLTCEIVGRPCCIGQEAKCEIVTKEYCDNKRGVFHPEATLCSQVSCMQDTCGLIEFRIPDYPDQLYRLWLSILLHAGIFHCCISVIFQMTVLRDMEKLAGWLRISLIYIFSGITGNLGSAIFLPYRAEVGPAGSHFGILACLFVEIFQSWQMLKSPGRALLKLFGIAIVLFLFGALPWIDNFAHIFGFLSGLLLSFVFLPYITFSDFDRRRKRIQVITCLVIFIAVFTLLVIFFYVEPLSDCPACRYLNCIPITDFFCSNHGFQPTEREL